MPIRAQKLATGIPASARIASSAGSGPGAPPARARHSRAESVVRCSSARNCSFSARSAPERAGAGRAAPDSKATCPACTNSRFQACTVAALTPHRRAACAALHRAESTPRTICSFRSPATATFSPFRRHIGPLPDRGVSMRS
jgi:hypothetical protein